MFLDDLVPFWGKQVPHSFFGCHVLRVFLGFSFCHWRVPMKSKMNLCKMIEQFDSEEKCRAYIEMLRWPDGVICMRCQSKKIYRLENRPLLLCASCEHQFSVTVGTIFHDTHLPLEKWFLATFLLCEAKKGMSACQVQRSLGISYKTAWYLCHRIRRAMTEVNPAPLKGTVELDETWIGGKRHWKERTYLLNKIMVLGAIERGGSLRMKAEKRSKNPNQQIVREWINEVTASDAQNLYTDQHPAYFGIQDADTAHESVDHSKGEYVRGAVHTNSIENAWSLFKRSVIGSYHKLSDKHLDAYLDEFEWRFNNRKNPYLFRDTILKLIASSNLEYKELTAQQAEPAA
jgi:transposase-like protein